MLKQVRKENNQLLLQYYEEKKKEDKLKIVDFTDILNRHK